MRLSMSNLAWDSHEEEEVVGLLRQYGYKGIEIAPTKIWPTPVDVSEREAREYRLMWADRGLELAAMQSLLYQQPDFQLFGDPGARARLGQHVRGLMRLAAWLGVKALVFGSPGNRVVGASRSREEAWELAAAFFGEMAGYAEGLGVTLCLEPNPVQYGCDFVTNTEEGLELVRAVGRKGFRLHLDVGAMILNGESIRGNVEKAVSLLGHVHVSEPFLQPVGAATHEEAHREAAEALRGFGYDGYVSIEMKRVLSEGGRYAAVDALKRVKDIYGSGLRSGA